MKKTKYRVLVVKYKDVPQTLYTQVFYTEDEAVKDAQEKLWELAGDAVIVIRVEGTKTEILHRYEWAKPGTGKTKAASFA